MASQTASPLGYRRRRALYVCVALAVFAAWLLVPPLDSPDVLCRLTYAQLRERMGPPTEEAPEKYIGWVSSRGIGWWMVEVPYVAAPRVDEKPTEVERHLALGVVGYSFNFLRTSSKW